MLIFHLKKQKIFTHLSEINTSFLRIGSCSLHPVHTAFAKGIKKLFVGTITLDQVELIKTATFDLDEYFNDIHFFFKKSSAHREDYKSLEKVTGIVAEYAKRHAETRWLTMKYEAFLA